MEDDFTLKVVRHLSDLTQFQKKKKSERPFLQIRLKREPELQISLILL